MSKVKSSYPKLHSIKPKKGLHAPNMDFLPTASFSKLSADDVLYGAHMEGLDEVIVIGKDFFGNEYIAFSDPNLHKAHYLLQRASLVLLRDGDTLEW